MKKLLKVIGYMVLAWVVFNVLNFITGIAILMNL